MLWQYRPSMCSYSKFLSDISWINTVKSYEFSTLGQSTGWLKRGVLYELSSKEFKEKQCLEWC